VRKILSEGTDSVYKQNSSGSFPVHLAAESGSFAVINEILKMCPDAGELLNERQRNFLHIAVEKENLGLISSACRKGVNKSVKHAKDKDGNTPLHLAVISADLEIFTLLFQNDEVNPNVKNKMGQTPLDISATLKNHQFKYSQVFIISTYLHILMQYKRKTYTF
jgi:ankyrin repeat protein